MRSYELDLRMDPVQWSPCTLTLVQNVGSFLGINVDTLTGDNRERPAGVNLKRYRCNVTYRILIIIVSFLDHQPLLVLTTLKLVASARQAPYLACLRVLRLAIRPRSTSAQATARSTFYASPTSPMAFPTASTTLESRDIVALMGRGFCLLQALVVDLEPYHHVKVLELCVVN